MKHKNDFNKNLIELIWLGLAARNSASIQPNPLNKHGHPIWILLRLIEISIHTSNKSLPFK